MTTENLMEYVQNISRSTNNYNITQFQNQSLQIIKIEKMREIFYGWVWH